MSKRKILLWSGIGMAVVLATWFFISVLLVIIEVELGWWVRTGAFRVPVRMVNGERTWLDNWEQYVLVGIDHWYDIVFYLRFEFAVGITLFSLIFASSINHIYQPSSRKLIYIAWSVWIAAAISRPAALDKNYDATIGFIRFSLVVTSLYWVFLWAIQSSISTLRRKAIRFQIDTVPPITIGMLSVGLYLCPYILWTQDIGLSYDAAHSTSLILALSFSVIGLNYLERTWPSFPKTISQNTKVDE
jgi:hypothetical protein